MAEKSAIACFKEELEPMIDTSKEREQWSKPSIYKLPATMTVMNKKAYIPQVVSFGPYHNGAKNLEKMEYHKKRATARVINRSKERKVEVLWNALEEVEKEIKECYDSFDVYCNNGDKFLRMMILDGCFMLEMLRPNLRNNENSYDRKDPIFSSHGDVYIMRQIRRDMLMMENQLPMLVLKKLLMAEDIQTYANPEGELKERILNLFIPDSEPNSKNKLQLGTSLHILDVYRKSFINEDKNTNTCVDVLGPDQDGDRKSNSRVDSASELDRFDIRFEINDCYKLNDISFSSFDGVLKLPFIEVDENTESMFLNLMAYERFHVEVGNEVTSYIYLMINLIKNSSDARLLYNKRIINCASHTTVAKMFREFSKVVTPNPFGLKQVFQDVNNYQRAPPNIWIGRLRSKYFRTPIQSVSLGLALYTFFLALPQTVYTILQYYQK